MALTIILKDREIKSKFKAEFPSARFNLKSELKASPLTNNYRLVGMAFDYLFRIFLEYINKDTFIKREKSVADEAYELLVTGSVVVRPESRVIIYPILGENFGGEEIATGYNRDKIYKKRDLVNIISSQYEQTNKNYSTFLSNGQITDELISNAIFLAKLDAFYRSHVIDSNFDFHNPLDVKDLKNLISIVNTEHFIAQNKLYSNPIFGTASALVGGADADLIIDNTLIDIKVTKNFGLNRDHLNQLLGYYVLSLIGGINDNPNAYPIENIGIYFARHGELWTLPVSYFGDNKKFESFKNWFVDYIANILNKKTKNPKN